MKTIILRARNGKKKTDGPKNPSAFFLSLFKSTLGTKAHTFSTDNAFSFINFRQRINILLCNRPVRRMGPQLHDSIRYRGCSGRNADLLK